MRASLTRILKSYVLKLVMKKILFLLILLLPSPAFADPLINFESETHNFGKVKQGELLEYTFEFANAGTKDLIIERIGFS